MSPKDIPTSLRVDYEKHSGCMFEGYREFPKLLKLVKGRKKVRDNKKIWRDRGRNKEEYERKQG